MLCWLLFTILGCFERVCMISKAKPILIKLLTHEPLLIVRSRTKNYKPYLNQVSFISLWHLRLERSLIFEIESLARVIVTNWGVSFHISYGTKSIINFSFKTHVSRIRLSLITETYHYIYRPRCTSHSNRLGRRISIRLLLMTSSQWEPGISWFDF